MTYSFIPILIMLVIAVAFGGVFLGLNWIVGKHQRNPSKLAPYESGVPMLDVNRKRVRMYSKRFCASSGNFSAASFSGSANRSGA